MLPAQLAGALIEPAIAIAARLLRLLQLRRLTRIAVQCLMLADQAAAHAQLRARLHLTRCLQPRHLLRAAITPQKPLLVVSCRLSVCIPARARTVLRRCSTAR